VQWPDILDVARAVVVPGCALAAVVHHLGAGLRQVVLELVRGKAEVDKVRATGQARVAEVEAETVGKLAVIEATNRARINELVVEHELRLALERERAARPRRQLDRGPLG
jgi:formiminotetrahydrofolate cyclodeaminase